MPFTLTFISDLFEDTDGAGAQGESSLNQPGFQLVYFQDAICTNLN